MYLLLLLAFFLAQISINATDHLIDKNKTTWNPKNYKANSRTQYSYGIKIIDKLALNGNETILDVGSGDGKVTYYLAQRLDAAGKGNNSSIVLGIDKNSSMVDFANENHKADNLNFRVQNVETMQYKNDFDLVISFATLHWTKDYSKAIENIYQSLKPLGKAILCHAVDFLPIEKHIKTTLNKPKWKKYLESYTPQMNPPAFSHIVNIITQLGFGIEKLEYKERGALFIPYEEYVNKVAAIPFVPGIPQEEYKKFCRDMTEEYIKEYPMNEKGEIKHWLPYISMYLVKK